MDKNTGSFERFYLIFAFFIGIIVLWGTIISIAARYSDFSLYLFKSLAITFFLPLYLFYFLSIYVLVTIIWRKYKKELYIISLIAVFGSSLGLIIIPIFSIKGVISRISFIADAFLGIFLVGFSIYTIKKYNFSIKKIKPIYMIVIALVFLLLGYISARVAGMILR